MDAHARWNQTWAKINRSPEPHLVDQLVSAYSEPHRAYHTLRHLEECFTHLDSSPERPADIVSLELALWFHDAIYDTRGFDNEVQSAAWARSALGALSPSMLDQIEGLILVTRHEAEPETADEALLLDIDLSIFGAAPERFDEYERQIRIEFNWVPEEAYRAARARILTQFQARPLLYHTPHFRELLESQARRNLSLSLESLAV